MLEIDQIHLRAVMLCMLEMSKMSKIDQIHLRAVMLFMSETSEIVIIFNIHRYGWKALSLSFPKLFSD